MLMGWMGKSLSAPVGFPLQGDQREQPELSPAVHGSASADRSGEIRLVALWWAVKAQQQAGQARIPSGNRSSHVSVVRKSVQARA